MEEGTKKPIMIGIIVVCVAVAGFIFYRTRPHAPRIPEEFKNEMIWVKCANPDCGECYQVNKYDFYKENEDYCIEHNTQIAPPPVCRKCGKRSIYEAVKCPKCGEVFIKGWKRGDYEDRCPKCGYSQIEVNRKNKMAGGAN